MTRLLAFLVALGFASPLAWGHERCRPIHAALTAQLGAAGCDSPFGLCTAGQLRGDLHGDTRFSVLALAPSAGLGAAEPESSLSYLGRFVLTGRDGTLTVADLGLLDGATGAFTEIWRITAGTGGFSGASGTLWLNGSTDATGGFNGLLTGRLCF